MDFRHRLSRRIVRHRGLLFALTLVLCALSVTMIGRTRINYDLTRYLSEDTMTSRALRVMQEEFGPSEQLRIMITEPEEGEVRELTETLSALPEVQFARHDPSTDLRVTEGKERALITLTLFESDASALVENLREHFAGRDECYVGGSVATLMEVQRSIASEMPAVMGISVAIVLVVLLLTSHAWLEPAVVLLSLAVSILINMGTNFIFADVSYITFAVCAILQLALSIDYAIMLLHTRNACIDAGMEPKEAMAEALSQCLMRIFSSALTTIAGLLSLVFMSFTIGFDIGLVLSKGILVSMLTVFTFMPAVVMAADGPLRRTRHRPLRFGGEKLAGFILRRKKAFAALLVLAVLFGAYLNTRTVFAFSDSGKSADREDRKIITVFGADSPLVLLVPGGDEDADWAREKETAEELLALRLPGGGSAVRQIGAMVTTGAEALKTYTAQDVAELTGMSRTAVNLFFLANGFGSAVRADRLLDAADAFSGDARVAELRESLRQAREAFIGPNFHRMLLSLSFDLYDGDFTAGIESILETVRRQYGDDFYITGLAMSTYDIANAFRGDLVKVNLITLFAILLIVILSFRAVLLPLLLVFVIEGAIFITMGISFLINEPIYFITYLICLSIQMGATIDYGILLSDQYRSLRREGRSVTEALKEAMQKALPTVLTSGLILMTAGFTVGRVCSIYFIYSIGLLIARGALVSVILVLTLLPALLALCDGAVSGRRAGEAEAGLREGT